MLFPEDTGPRQKTPSFVKNTYLQDFKDERLDKKNPRLKKKGKLQRKELKDNVVPSQWPMCPTLLSKPPLQEWNTANTSSESRRDKQLERKDMTIFYFYRSYL